MNDWMNYITREMCKVTKNGSKKDKLQHCIQLCLNEFLWHIYIYIINKNIWIFVKCEHLQQENWETMFSFFYLVDLLHTYFYNQIKASIYIIYLYLQQQWKKNKNGEKHRKEKRIWWKWWMKLNTLYAYGVRTRDWSGSQ